MKKFLSVMFLTAILIFAGNSLVSAQDFYCGTYENGEKAYLMTETISKYSTGDSAGFSCRVKSVKNNGNFSYIEYKFMTEPSQGITKNGVTLGQGRTGQLLRNENSVEYNIWNYFIRNRAR